MFIYIYIYSIIILPDIIKYHLCVRIFESHVSSAIHKSKTLPCAQGCKSLSTQMKTHL